MGDQPSESTLSTLLNFFEVTGKRGPYNFDKTQEESLSCERNGLLFAQFHLRDGFDSEAHQVRPCFVAAVGKSSGPQKEHTAHSLL